VIRAPKGDFEQLVAQALPILESFVFDVH